MQLTKTDFIHYLKCPKSLWLEKRAPETYPHGKSSAFERKLAREGYEVERYVHQFFESEIRPAEFQRAFTSRDGLFARADAVEETESGETVLYEIKSSNSVKDEHLGDACFQKICAERTGQNVDRVILVHLNGDYVRRGEVDPGELLKFTDVTAQIEAIEDETVAEIDAALAFLAKEIDRIGCPCLEKARGNHCDTFTLFNPGVPVPSIYSLPRLSAGKRKDFLKKGIFGLAAIPDDYPLSERQRLVVQAARSGEPQVNAKAVQDFLSELVFPLHFLDYETFASAVPLIDGASPHKHFPVQYSLHILEEDGSLMHREYLEREARMPHHLVEKMHADIGPEGSVVSWHAPFEKARNRDMADTIRMHAEFLNDVNERMVDLEDVFKADYVDARFDGSTSIKNVLPIVCPHLDYSDLDVQDGAVAMEAWRRMIDAEPEEASEIARALLKYCRRDTFAMVEIHRFLHSV